MCGRFTQRLSSAEFAAVFGAADLAGTPGEAYNVGETNETSILELARKIIAAANKTGRLVVKTRALAGATADALDVLARRGDRVSDGGASPSTSERG